MDCVFEDAGSAGDDGKRHAICRYCGELWPIRTATPNNRLHRNCLVMSGRVGSCLYRLLKSLRITADSLCHCAEMIAKMNAWGPDGCPQHRDEILAHLREAYDSASLATKAKALPLAIWNGHPLTLEGLLDLAIERATQPQNQSPQSPDGPA